MHLALRRQMRLPLPFTRAKCGGEGAPGCRTLTDNLGDHALACPRTGLLARRSFVLEKRGSYLPLRTACLSKSSHCVIVINQSG